MQDVTTIVDFTYRGTKDGREYVGEAQSTEYWKCPDGPVNKGALLEMHKAMWLDRMRNEKGVTVHPGSVRVANTQFLI
jgi:hypothetical protein